MPHSEDEHSTISDDRSKKAKEYTERLQSELNFDSKVSSLLTHVSIMTAILTALYALEPSLSIWRGPLFVELLFYIIITIACLRCIEAYDNAAILAARYQDVVGRRRRRFNRARRAALLATIALAITLAAKQLNLQMPTLAQSSVQYPQTGD